jgi:hypothetical protein
MAYVPQPFNTFSSFEEMSRFLQAELLSISSSIGQAENGYQEVLSVAPDKPREGLVVYADGTNWNPGGGAGLYEYAGGVWRRLNTTVVDATETIKGIVELATVAEAIAGTSTVHAVTPAGSKAAWNLAWPIGAVFISVVSTNPNTLLGFGTWTAFATGRTIVGIDSGQTEFNVVEETGGTKTHTLTIAEMPAHDHDTTVGGAAFKADGAVGPGTNAWSNQPSGGQTKTGSSGGGNAHNNLQPYIVVYMWKRTA